MSEGDKVGLGDGAVPVCALSANDLDVKGRLGVAVLLQCSVLGREGTADDRWENYCLEVLGSIVILFDSASCT
jgi:hypothetical protein